MKVVQFWKHPRGKSEESKKKTKTAQYEYCPLNYSSGFGFWPKFFAVRRKM